MTAEQRATFEIIVDGLWSGQVSENEFIEVGLNTGIPAERLNDVLNAIRKEDGVYQ